MVKRSVFDKIFREMQSIHFRLDDLEKNLSGWRPAPLEISEPRLIELSDHLRKTYMTVASKGESDADDVSSSTGRCRALESNYLNQLCRMGWLNKRKMSKSTLFYLASERQTRIPAANRGESRLAVPMKRISGDFRKYFAEP
jgi:hypothetical protein